MKRLAALLAVVSLLTSCEGVPEASSTVPPTSTTTSAAASSTIGSTTSTSPASATSTSAVPGAEVPVYLFFEGYPVEPGPYLAPVARVGVDDLDGSLGALLAGATSVEADQGLTSTIPEGTRLLGVEVLDGVALVDLSAEFESGGGSLSMMGRVAQVVYTATAFEGVEAVRFLVEGTQLDVLGGEGLIIDEPQARADWVDLLPPILVEEPRFGSSVGGEVVVAGTAELDSGVVSFVVVDADGLIVREGEAMATPGVRSGFSVTVDLGDVAHPGTGSLIAWEWAADGSQRFVVDYPIDLSG